MNRPDLIRLIHESGMTFHLGMPHEKVMEQLGRFAELVAAAEREVCAISCEVNAARWVNSGGKQWYAAHECASAIRARGKP